MTLSQIQITKVRHDAAPILLQFYYSLFKIINNLSYCVFLIAYGNKVCRRLCNRERICNHNSLSSYFLLQFALFGSKMETERRRNHHG